jgi:hypothetical protein
LEDKIRTKIKKSECVIEKLENGAEIKVRPEGKALNIKSSREIKVRQTSKPDQELKVRKRRKK